MSIAAIQIQRKKLGLSDARYRTVLANVAGVRSSRDLTPAGDKAVYAALCKMARATTPQARYIWVLWEELQPYLPPAERTGAYLAGLIRRSSGAVLADLSDLSGLSGKELHKGIEAIKLRLAAEQEKIKTEVPF